MSLTECSSVANIAGGAVILRVSASSEGQEQGNETGLMKKRTKSQILKINYVYGSPFCRTKFIKYLGIACRYHCKYLGKFTNRLGNPKVEIDLLVLTSALDVAWWSKPPRLFYPQEIPVPIVFEVGWAPVQV
jgi:hypothetical protein